MWSMNDFPFMTPAGSWRSTLSTAVVLRRMMRLKTLLVMDSSVKTLQFKHSDKFPFFGSVMIVPIIQASGINSSSKTSWRMR